MAEKKPEKTPKEDVAVSVEDANEQITKLDGYIYTYGNKLASVVNAEGLFEPKIEGVHDLSQKICDCLEKRQELSEFIAKKKV